MWVGLSLFIVYSTFEVVRCRLGGVMVSVVTIRPKFAGSNLAEELDF
jgi:hypothetical protein